MQSMRLFVQRVCNGEAQIGCLCNLTLLALFAFLLFVFLILILQIICVLHALQPQFIISLSAWYKEAALLRIKGIFSPITSRIHID